MVEQGTNNPKQLWHISSTKKNNIYTDTAYSRELNRRRELQL